MKSTPVSVLWGTGSVTGYELEVDVGPPLVGLANARTQTVSPGLGRIDAACTTGSVVPAGTSAPNDADDGSVAPAPATGGLSTLSAPG